MKVSALAPWFGSKRTLAAKIVDLLGPHRAYFEPFCGSMAVLLSKPACSFETVCDLHRDLTSLAWVIAHPRLGPQLYRRLRRTFFSEELFDDCKDRIEDHPLADAPTDLDGREANAILERAYCYFVLCWMGRSGVLGTARSYNVFTIRYTANGGNSAIRFASAVESLPSWRRRLRSVTILRRSGLDVLEKVPDESGYAVYADPPYFVKNAQYEHDFNDADHRRLALLLSSFERTRIVVSYYEHPLLSEFYPPDRWTKIDCSRAKHLSIQGRRGAEIKEAPEVLLVNEIPSGLSDTRHQEHLFHEDEANAVRE